MSSFFMRLTTSIIKISNKMEEKSSLVDFVIDKVVGVV